MPRLTMSSSPGKVVICGSNTQSRVEVFHHVGRHELSFKILVLIQHNNLVSYTFLLIKPCMTFKIPSPARTNNLEPTAHSGSE